MKNTNLNTLKNLPSICLLLLLTFLCVSCGGDSKTSNSFQNYKIFEGSWRYKVKARNTLLVNPQAFTEGFMEKPDYSNLKGHTFAFGNVQMKPTDDFYNGYFSLSTDEAKSFEIDGGYFPDMVSVPAVVTPLELQKIQPKDFGLELNWKVDLRKRNSMPFETSWITRAYYLKKLDVLIGMTVVESCHDKHCEVTNIVRWKADRIPEISYYDRQNYSTKAVFYELVRPLDPKGKLTKKLFDSLTGKPSNAERVHESLKPSFSKVPLSAMLPAVASISTGKMLDELCDPNFCPTRAPYYASFTKNKQNSTYEERRDACTQTLRVRTAMCCKGGGNNSMCDCYSTNNSTAPDSLCCCRVLNVDCTTETKTQLGNGGFQIKKDTTRVETKDLTKTQRIAIEAGSTQAGSAALGQSGANPNFFVGNRKIVDIIPPSLSTDPLRVFV